MQNKKQSCHMCSKPSVTVYGSEKTQMTGGELFKAKYGDINQGRFHFNINNSDVKLPCGLEVS